MMSLKFSSPNKITASSLGSNAKGSVALGGESLKLS